MALLVFLFLLGLALVILGADWLVDGASAVARRAGISEFVIGLSIVSIGTSAPELVVSVVGALKGSPEIALGNVLGSNIMNVLLILGLTAIIMPIGFTKSNKQRDVTANIAVSVLFLCLGMSHFLFGIGRDMLSRADGLLLILLFIIYIYVSFRLGGSKQEKSDGSGMPILKALTLIVIGLAALIFGGRMFVDSAVEMAHRLHISEKFIAVTIVAGGTSVPELVTCVVAALKKKGQLALGNIIGSNIFNILLILGCASLVRGLPFRGIDLVDAGVLLLSSLLMLLSAWTGKDNKISRADGAIMLACWLAYMTWLFIKL